MDFLSDLTLAIVSEFRHQGISFPECADLGHLASRYLEMRMRRIEPVPRKVHFSEEIHDSLGNLARDTDPKGHGKGLEAWKTVFYLRHLLESGLTVTPFLSDKVINTETKDGLLWDYAMHHLHLSRKDGKGGFVARSDWLLFVVVPDQDVFFVDVSAHRAPGNLQWVHQDLLGIVFNNWPELIESRRRRLWVHSAPGPVRSCSGRWPLSLFGKPLGEVDVQGGGPYQVGHLLLRFAVPVVEAVDVQEPCPGVILRLQDVERRIQGAQPQKSAPCLSCRLRLFPVPCVARPRLLRRVADLPLVEHLDGVIVERPCIGEEEVHPVRGYHSKTSRAARRPLRWSSIPAILANQRLVVHGQRSPTLPTWLTTSPVPGTKQSGLR